VSRRAKKSGGPGRAAGDRRRQRASEAIGVSELPAFARLRGVVVAALSTRKPRPDDVARARANELTEDMREPRRK
jgi:hypothetical protein